jgi:hypothetical protein
MAEGQFNVRGMADDLMSYYLVLLPTRVHHQLIFFYFLCTVSGCDGGNRTRNIAVYTWRFSLLSYDSHHQLGHRFRRGQPA